MKKIIATVAGALLPLAIAAQEADINAITVRLDSRIVLIPGVAYANICSKHDVAPDGTEFVGIGIKPDIEISETHDSFFGKAGSPVVKAALGLLR